MRPNPFAVLKALEAAEKAGPLSDSEKATRERFERIWQQVLKERKHK